MTVKVLHSRLIIKGMQGVRNLRQCFRCKRPDTRSSGEADLTTKSGERDFTSETGEQILSQNIRLKKFFLQDHLNHNVSLETSNTLLPEGPYNQYEAYWYLQEITHVIGVKRVFSLRLSHILEGISFSN